MHTNAKEDCDATEGNRDNKDWRPPMLLPEQLIGHSASCQQSQTSLTSNLDSCAYSDVSLLDGCYSVVPADATVQSECYRFCHLVI